MDMADFACPACGEADELRGERGEDGIVLICDRCEHRWPRDSTRRCPTCGGPDLAAAPKAVVEKVRGDQMSLVGTYTVHLCRICDKQILDVHVRTGAPVPPDVLPVDSRRGWAGAPGDRRGPRGPTGPGPGSTQSR